MQTLTFTCQDQLNYRQVTRQSQTTTDESQVNADVSKTRRYDRRWLIFVSFYRKIELLRSSVSFKKFLRIYSWCSPLLEKQSSADDFWICERLPKKVNIVQIWKVFEVKESKE